MIDTVDNQEAGYIIGWDGANWDYLQMGLNGPVMSLESYNGLLYAGGWFTSTWYGEQMRYIAAWDGADWGAVGAGVNSGVNTLFGYGGRLYVGGWFTNSFTVPSSYLATWDGAAFGSIGTPDDGVHAICGDEGIIYAAGSFLYLDNVLMYFVAKYAAPGVDVPENTTTGLVSVYPNPASGIVTVSSQGITGTKIMQVYSSTGTKSEELTFEGEAGLLDMRTKAPGIYCYRLMCDGNLVKSGTLVVE